LSTYCNANLSLFFLSGGDGGFPSPEPEAPSRWRLGPLPDIRSLFVSCRDTSPFSYAHSYCVYCSARLKMGAAAQGPVRKEGQGVYLTAAKSCCLLVSTRCYPAIYIYIHTCISRSDGRSDPHARHSLFPGGSSWEGYHYLFCC
jgi:hypothetical protein